MAPVIDAHHHLWDPGAREYRWLCGDQPWASDEDLARLRRPCTLAELSPLAADAGVSASVAVQTVDDVWETRDLLALAAGLEPWDEGAHSSRSEGLLTAVVGWLDLTAADVGETVAHLRSLPGGSRLRGIRHPLLDEPDPGWLTRPEVLRGLRKLGEEGLSFDVVAPPSRLEVTALAARSVPGLCFVLDHLGAPPLETRDAAGMWAGAVRALAAQPNVVCKLSGAHGPSARAGDLRPSYETVLEAFGPDRLLFGSDWPVSSLSAPYGEICAMYRELTADLSPAERDAVFEHTARRVYRLGPGDPERPPTGEPDTLAGER